MIRRTRKEIMEFYGEDLKKQGLKFPEVANPEPLLYELDAIENEIFDETVRLLTKEFNTPVTSRWNITRAKQPGRKSKARSTLPGS